MKKVSGLRSIFILMLLISLLTAGFTPLRTVATPEPKAPSGIITDATPTYKWSPVSGATSYQYRVERGSVIVIDKTVTAAACGAVNCSHTPTTVLDNAAHKWSVRAKAGTTWSDWSAYKYFTVTPPPTSFNSQFNGKSIGWAKLGAITWAVSPSCLFTAGTEDDYANVYHSTSIGYKNFEYEIRTKCTTTGFCENFIAFRMGKKINSVNNFWYPGYIYGYDSLGYRTFKMIKSDGSFGTSIKAFDSDILIGDWNTIKVIADGNFLSFYINGELNTTVRDSTHKIGAVGVMMHETGESLFKVDWAILTLLP